MCPSWPRKSGWSAAMLTSEKFAPQTSAPSSSATRVSSAWAPEKATPSPTIAIGREAPASIATAALRPPRRPARRACRGCDVGTTSSSIVGVEHVHRQRHEHRPARRRRGDLDRPAQHAQRRGRVDDARRPLRHRLRHRDEVGGHLGVHRVVADARLAGDHDERRPAALGLVHHPDPVAEPDAAVQLDERRLLGRARVAVGDPDRDRLLQRRDVAHLRVRRRARPGTPARPCRGCRTCR